MTFPVSSTLLDACVLGVLSKSDAYGYRLTSQLSQAVELSESTLYPVLRRLQKFGLLDTYDQPFDGRNRRYYRITEDGKKQNMLYKLQWTAFKKNIDSVIEGEIADE